jgi:hypothetical protein
MAALQIVVPLTCTGVQSHDHFKNSGTEHVRRSGMKRIHHLRGTGGSAKWRCGRAPARNRREGLPDHALEEGDEDRALVPI